MASASVAPDPESVERSRDRRADAMQARTVLWSESRLKRVQSCGRWSIRHDKTVAIRSTSVEGGGRVAGFAGVASCGSVWACPVCSRKIAASRQSDIEHAVDYWEREADGAIALGTFTVSHKSYNSLTSVWDAVSAGWGSITSGSAWLKNKAKYGIEGWCRVIETNYGEKNGWHVHVHVVFFLTRGLGAVAREDLTTAMHGRWNAGISKHGFRSSREHGADIKMMHGSDAAAVLADYFVKGVYQASGDQARSVALEAARGDLKISKGGTRTPFQLLQHFLATGDVDELAVWHEWERGSKGRRQMAWSKGFRDLVRLCAERTDEDIAADELGSAADDVVVLSKEAFLALRHEPWVPLDLLEVAGPVALRTWLDSQGVEWFEPGERGAPPLAGGRQPSLSPLQ